MADTFPLPLFKSVLNRRGNHPFLGIREAPGNWQKIQLPILVTHFLALVIIEMRQLLFTGPLVLSSGGWLVDSGDVFETRQTMRQTMGTRDQANNREELRI
jgi:hypothetical protein